MKKIIILLLCISIVFSLFSCKRNENINDEEIASALYDETINSGSESESEMISEDEDISWANTDNTAIDEQISSDDSAESKRDESLGKEYPEDEKGDNYNTGHGEEEKYDLQDHTDDPLRYIGDYIVSNHDFEELPSHTMVEAEYTSYNFMPIDELEKEVLSQNGIVIRGIKKENSTQYTSKDEEVWFSETPIEILEVYAGDAKVGDSILMYEDAGVLHSETGNCIVALINGNHPIKKETEYILFLYPGTSISGSGERIYVPHDSHLSNGLGRQKITEQIKSAKTSEEAGLEGLKKDIFDRYYFK